MWCSNFQNTLKNLAFDKNIRRFQSLSITIAMLCSANFRTHQNVPKSHLNRVAQWMVKNNSTIEADTIEQVFSLSNLQIKEIRFILEASSVRL
ncbi:hypothetical protein [Enterobacter sp. R1(2018)]|uniref:hypothetical protein n=1 Tax=Enterobacter sp. R1(2018) TaxID=2447891 RepID=UPI000EB49C35|nr:hypothetical protein [Enterobacter sp. R1(2018)]RKQ41421.1 hypothetical protein D8M09_00175 [Enterobacter sp. R1(2018)]